MLERMATTSLPVLFGRVPGVNEGDTFSSRQALYNAKVHRSLQAGIAGGAREGADSIVMSGGYPDDRECGDVILYTGHGGRGSNGAQVRDQNWSSPGNAGLVLTSALRKPLRVIKGLAIKRGKATGGYRYEGLYHIVDFWKVSGKEGFQICQFELHKLHGDEESIPPPRPRPVIETEAEQRVRRLVAAREEPARDLRIVQRVKELYRDTCQMCRARVVVAPEGQAFSNCAHIKALGRPYDGPDILENVLCLCPNCHIRFDRGALQITDDFQVIDTLEGRKFADLYRVGEHHIDVQYLGSHRSRWPGRMEAWLTGPN
ncbi:YDG/SRA domain-containing protein [Streptomyces reniochalinae]|nr:YDG/SRA domain-containing protein [Streptomyces reniochalinae]